MKITCSNKTDEIEKGRPLRWVEYRMAGDADKSSIPMNRAKWFVLVGTLCFLIQGCATANKPLTVKNMEEVTSIKVVRTGYPGYLMETAGSQAAAFTGIMFGAIGGAVGGGISASMQAKSGKELAEKYCLPDVNKLITERFVERVRTDLPDWPKLEVIETPVEKEYKPGPDYVLMIKGGVVNVNSMAYGFSMGATASMTGPGGEVVWERGYLYKSSDFSKKRSIESLEADNCKLLKEELDFAVDQIVSEFIRHLKGGISTGKPSAKQPPLEGQNAPAEAPSAT